MIEEQGLDNRLQEVDEVIVAATMGQFVRDDRLQLPLRQPDQRAGRDQDDRS